jgi:hypothetical protein
VGYFVTGKLKTIEVTGGAPLSLADAPNARGGSWGPNDEILFTPDIRSGVYRVPAAGGTPVAVTKPEATGHTTHRWPHVLPDGEHFLYLAANHNEPRSENTGVFFASTDGKENRRVMGTLSSAVYAAGHLLFLREGTLMAQPFDPVRGSLSGEPVRVQDRVVFDNGIWRGLFSASESALIYEAGELARGSLLTWYDRSGKPLGNVGQREAYGGVELSPDGHQLAVTIDGPPRDVWIFDLDRGFKKRLTVGADKSEINALWAPDGRSLFYTGYLPDATYGIYRQPIGGGAEQLISGPHKFALARDVSPDLRYMLMDTGAMGTEDISLRSLAGDGKLRTLVGTPFWERDGQFSPDGRWVAITSRESGRDEVYVISVSHPGKWQVSNQGGQTPRWRRDGKELFFLGIAAPYTLNVAAVNGGGETFHVGAVRSLFHANLVASPFGDVSYDVTADGQRLIATVSGETSEQVKPLSLVLNWKGLLKK